MADQDGGTEARVVRFGETEMDLRALEIRRRGVVQPVEPQIFDVVVHPFDACPSRHCRPPHRRHLIGAAMANMTEAEARRAAEAQGYRLESATAATRLVTDNGTVAAGDW